MQLSKETRQVELVNNLVLDTRPPIAMGSCFQEKSIYLMLKDPVETTGHEKPEAENECRGFTIFHKVANNDHKVAVKN